MRIVGTLKRDSAIDIKAMGGITATDMQRNSTLDKWTAMLKGEGEEKQKEDEVIFQVKRGKKEGLAALVFVHPAGGLVGPFNKVFAALGDDRDIWAIEHPYFVNDDYDPRSTTLATVGTCYADGIIKKLGLEDKPGQPGTAAKKWVLCTYSAGGIWANETFHQINMRGAAPHLVLLLDAGWGVMTGPWDSPCWSCCCRLDCCCCPLCEPTHTCCEAVYCCLLACCRPCQHMKYGPRMPSRNANQPLSWNAKLPSGVPEGMKKANIKDAYGELRWCLPPPFA